VKQREKMKHALIIASFFLRGVLVESVLERPSSARFFELTRRTMSSFDEYIDRQEKREARNKELRDNIRRNMTRNKKPVDLTGNGNQVKLAVENVVNGANHAGEKVGNKRDAWVNVAKGAGANQGGNKLSSLELAAAAGNNIPQVTIPNLRSRAKFDEELDKKVNEKKELRRNTKKEEEKKGDGWEDVKAKSKSPPKTHEAEGQLPGRFWAQANDNRFDALSDNEEDEGREKDEQDGIQDKAEEQGFAVGKKGSPNRGSKNKKNKKKKKKQEQAKAKVVIMVPPEEKITVETVAGDEVEDGAVANEADGDDGSLQSVKSEYGVEGENDESVDGKPHAVESVDVQMPEVVDHVCATPVKGGNATQPEDVEMCTTISGKGVSHQMTPSPPKRNRKRSKTAESPPSARTLRTCKTLLDMSKGMFSDESANNTTNESPAEITVQSELTDVTESPDTSAKTINIPDSEEKVGNAKAPAASPMRKGTPIRRREGTGQPRSGGSDSPNKQVNYNETNANHGRLCNNQNTRKETERSILRNCQPGPTQEVFVWNIASNQKKPAPKAKLPPVPTVPCSSANLNFVELSIPIQIADQKERINETFRVVEETVESLFSIEPFLRIFQHSAQDRAESKEFIDSMTAWREMMKAKKLVYLQRFVPGARTWNNEKEPGRLFVRMLLGSQLSIETIEKKCYGENFRMFLKKVQVEKTTTVGWLYRTHGSLEREKFEEELNKIVSFPVAVKWKKIWGSPKPPDKERALEFHAYHLDVNESSKKHDTLKLKEIFHASREQGDPMFPLGVECRFIEDLSKVRAESDKKKLRKMWAKQAAYKRRVIYKEDDQFTDIDMELDGLGGHTIRQFMMDLVSEEDETLPLFLGISRMFGKHNAGKWWVIVPPQCEEESDDVLQGLLPLLQYEIGRHNSLHDAIDMIRKVEEQFTEDTVETSREQRWDPIARCAVSMASDELDAQCNNPRDAKFDFTDMEDDLQVQEEEPKTKTKLKHTPDDISVGLDSVGTIGNDKSGRRRFARSTDKQEKWEAIFRNSTVNRDYEDYVSPNTSAAGPSPTGGDGRAL
jgi:hypothetical protein